MSYFLDTNICIYALKGAYPDIASKMSRIGPDRIKIPAIVKAELLYGAEKSHDPARTRSIVEQFLFPFEIVSFDDSSSAVYATLRSDLEKRGEPIGPNDLIIASTVISNNGTLVTHNQKEFAKIKKLSVEDWT